MAATVKSRKIQLEHLPEELHFKVLQMVKQIGFVQALAKCMRCCRKWRRIGKQLLYKDVVMTVGNTSKIAGYRHRLKEKFRKNLRCLTLSDEILSAGGKNSFLLIEIIQPPSRLETLSITIRDETSSVSEFLQNIPQSVENLEIDFKEENGTAEGIHICKQIRNCLTHIKRLSLRVNHICEDIFPPKDDWQNAKTERYSLRSMIVTSWRCEGLDWCDFDKDDAFGLFALYARACWLSGMFPACEYFTISAVAHQGLPHFGDCCMDLLLRRYDVLLNWQSSFPIIDASKFADRSTFIRKAASGQLFYESDQSLWTYIENDNGFSETVYGLRIPSPLTARRDGFQRDCPMRQVKHPLEGAMKPILPFPLKRYLETTDVVHGKPRFECCETYNSDRWEEVLDLINILKAHDSNV